VVLEEPFQGFPFSGDSDKVFFICQGRSICHHKRLQARLGRADMRHITRPAMTALFGGLLALLAGLAGLGAL